MDHPRPGDGDGDNQNPDDADDYGGISHQLDMLALADANLGQNQEVVEEIGPVQEDANLGQNQEPVEEIEAIQAADAAADANLGQNQEVVGEIGPVQEDANLGQNQEPVEEIEAIQAADAAADANLGQNQEVVEEIGPVQEDANLGQNQEPVEEIEAIQAADAAAQLQAIILTLQEKIGELADGNGKIRAPQELCGVVEVELSKMDLLLNQPPTDYSFTIVRINDAGNYHAIRCKEGNTRQQLVKLRRDHPNCKILLILRQCSNAFELFRGTQMFGNIDANYCDFTYDNEKNLVFLCLHNYFMQRYHLNIPEFDLPRG